jgi:hypothetical protein
MLSRFVGMQYRTMGAFIIACSGTGGKSAPPVVASWLGIPARMTAGATRADAETASIRHFRIESAANG